MKTILLLLTLGLLMPAMGKAKNDDETRGSITVAKRTPIWELAAQAKISAAEAMQNALAAEPGLVVEVELEVEDGALVYAVVIARSDHVLKEVIVDAGNGAILEVEDED